jgi:succinate dehydrogenase/fumarate reductase flavoprotein subunit
MEVSKKTLQEETIDTDVLVVGAGAGGMMAAISAADVGANVTLCEKGNIRRSGGLMGGNDHFACYIPEIHGPAVKENFIRDRLYRDPAGLVDEDLLRKQLDFSYDVLQKWESWGVNMKKNGHYEFVGHGWPGSSGKSGQPGKTDRMWLHFSDNEVCPKIEKQLHARKVNIMNRVMVTELLQGADGRVVGAVGISTREPKLFIFKAKSVVLNKGGYTSHTPTRLYPFPNLIGYSMAKPEAGENIMMAYRAGAGIQNAELCHRQVSLRFGPWSGKGTWIGVTRDCEGKPIAPPYLSKPDAELGDMAVENADAIDHAWATGKGPVWMDPRGISEEDEQYMRWGFESEALNHLIRWFDQERINIRKTRFEFIAMQPGSDIQVRIDANFKTAVEGLYVLLTHIGLAGSPVSGMVAGEAAAKDARSTKSQDLEKNRDRILQLKQQYEEILNREGHQYADWREAQWAIWQTMYCYALPPHRTESTLMAGYNQLLRLRERASRILKAGNQHDLYHCIEVLTLMDVAELVLLSVNERKESRGQARRQDYPFTNPLLNKFLVITQQDGKPTFRWETPRRISG